MSKPKLISPNDMQDAAKRIMLQGREPSTRHDWQLCANFWASNIQAGLEVSFLPVMGQLFDCPLTKNELVAIAKFQAERKGLAP